ncbi:transglutaminase-like cysteine proteinase BTLCP [Tistlia consotensis]|uniref:Transglutaminase-like cysteine proteinase BTLCP n=1 Tax=Tistlia consotensis USBA 355 TaxID=560819 RepID=A0A1Y6CHY6_9PROT|nr:transglutaminase-like cysteine peptidase [Tistlia consotensis]SMF63088.1 transglutaminase-like cysteine proteinase BTLCP [Tistlia consotensis USBA 355]SNR95517.1 transglutaminase-like cysteine proteinase BTLCP [Tistlia consotensis]
MAKRRHGIARRAAMILAAAAFALLATDAGAPARAAAGGDQPLDHVFGSKTFRNGNLKLFPKWEGMLSRYFAEGQVADSCTPGLFSRCDLADWQEFLDGEKGREPMRQLDAVNRYMNEHRYIIDPVNWGVDDYWATPLQFLHKDGDCEDYAIAKFMSLRALGWPDDALRIVVVNDLNLRVQHAILVVSLGGEAYVLDNQSPSVMRADRIRHYRPVYSVNEEAWWLHKL